MIARQRHVLSLPSPLRLLVALIVLIAASASGSTVAAAETGVAAKPVETAAAVAADADIGPGHVGSNTVVFDDFVSGCCVAPRGGPGGGDRIDFGQASVSRTFTSADRGSTFKYAGENIADVASGLRAGSISPNQLPIDYVVHNGQRVAVNNRSLLALRRAGLEPTVTRNVSSDAVVQGRVLGRLDEMGGAPSSTIRVRGAGRNASYLDWLWG